MSNLFTNYSVEELQDFAFDIYEKGLQDYKWILEHGTHILAYNKDGTVREKLETKEQLRKWLIKSDIANFVLEEPEEFIINFEKRLEDECKHHECSPATESYKTVRKDSKSEVERTGKKRTNKSLSRL